MRRLFLALVFGVAGVRALVGCTAILGISPHERSEENGDDGGGFFEPDSSEVGGDDAADTPDRGASADVSVSSDGGVTPSDGRVVTGGDAAPPTNDAALPDGAPSGTKLVPLTATNTGYVSPTNPVAGTTVPNTVGVTGSWYAYGDGWGTEGVDGGAGVAGERGNCELIGGFSVSACSSITAPLPASPFTADAGLDASAAPGYVLGFPPTPPNSQTFCLSGKAAQVVNGETGTLDYSDIYGIGMGFDFNNVNGVKASYNAAANNVVGIFFHISAVGTFPPLRVEFPTVGTNGAGGGDSYIVSPTANGDVTVIFATDLATPYPPVSGVNIGYDPPTGDTIPMFDPIGESAPTDLISIQFHVFTGTVAPVTVNQLCVSNLSAIVSTM